MSAVRGFRTLALVLAFVLATASVVFGISLRANAATQGHISGVVTDLNNVGVAVPGLTVHLMDFSVSIPVDLRQDVTAGDGSYDFDSVPDGDYLVYVDGGADWTDGIGGAIGFDDDDPAPPDADIEVEAAYSISGVVMGNGSPIPNALVEVYDNLGFVNDNTGSGFSPLHFFGTNADGAYTVKVPLTSEDYILIANGGPGWHEQAYNLVDDPPCGCAFPGPATVVPITTASVSGIDFDLTPYDPTFDLYVEQDDGTGTFNPIPGLTIVFEKLVGGTWTEVHRDVTDVNGELVYQAALFGDFRLRFEAGSAKVAYLDSLQYPRFDYDGTGGCYANYPGIGPGSYIAVDFGFHATYVSCATPTPPTTPGTGPRKPRNPAFSVGSFVIATPTPIPTPPPTSTPSPSPSQSGEPEPSATPTPDPAVEQNPFDLWWLWLILLILVALIIIVIVRLVTRR